MRTINYREYHRVAKLTFVDGPLTIDNETYLIFGIGFGWKPILEKLFEDLFAAGWDGELAQVKEKFGLLRVYLGEYKPGFTKIVDVAENESRRTCEKCGQPAEGPSRGGGYWVKTLCAEHSQERDNELIANGMARKEEKFND